MVPKIEQGPHSADRNAKTVTPARGRAIPGTYILGVQIVPKIEQGPHSADRDAKTVTPAEGHPIPGMSILGVQEAPKIAQKGADKGQFNTEQLDRREAKREEAAAAAQEAPETAVLRVDNPLCDSEFRENRLFNRGAEHTVETAPGEEFDGKRNGNFRWEFKSK